MTKASHGYVYTYDKVNNILSLENKAPIPSANPMGGSSEYSYEYDNLYRLTKAEGSFKGANDEHTYTLNTVVPMDGKKVIEKIILM